MNDIQDDFITTMRDLGATHDRAISLERVGPQMLALGHSLEETYGTLMRLSREMKIVLVEERNAVKFP